jgi:copper(I)-binding protein
MKRTTTLLLASLLALAACGSSDPVSIDNAWARASAEGQTRGAIYFDLTVDDDDVLLGADVPASVAGEAQVHEVVMADESMDEMSGDMDDDMDDSAAMEGSDDMGEMSGDMDEMSGDMDEMSGDMDGAMVMRELADGLTLEGGETVSFEPGGYHVMLLDLAAPLAVGDEIELTLDFAEAGATTLTVEVAASAP